MDISTNINSDLAAKVNLMEEDQITLKELVQGLKQKYMNAVVDKEEEIQEQ